MTNTPQKPPPEKPDREAKLAQALRANLRRRKAAPRASAKSAVKE